MSVNLPVSVQSCLSTCLSGILLLGRITHLFRRGWKEMHECDPLTKTTEKRRYVEWQPTSLHINSLFSLFLVLMSSTSLLSGCVRLSCSSSSVPPPLCATLASCIAIVYLHWWYWACNKIKCITLYNPYCRSIAEWNTQKANILFYLYFCMMKESPEVWMLKLTALIASILLFSLPLMRCIKRSEERQQLWVCVHVRVCVHSEGFEAPCRQPAASTHTPAMHVCANTQIQAQAWHSRGFFFFCSAATPTVLSYTHVCTSFKHTLTVEEAESRVTGRLTTFQSCPL